jgi:hypothetical protein
MFAANAAVTSDVNDVEISKTEPLVLPATAADACARLAEFEVPHQDAEITGTLPVIRIEPLPLPDAVHNCWPCGAVIVPESVTVLDVATFNLPVPRKFRLQPYDAVVSPFHTRDTKSVPDPAAAHANANVA